MKKIMKRVLATFLSMIFLLGIAPNTKAEETPQTTNPASVQTVDIKTESKTALMAVLSTLKKVKKYAYVDMTGDGVKDVFVNGVVYVYDGKTKSVKKIQLMYSPSKKLKKYGKMYISKKKKMVYFSSKDNKKYGFDADYSCYYTGWFYRMKDIKNSMRSEDGDYVTSDYRYFARYAKPKHFISKKDYKKGRKYYIFNYSTNDQDDAWWNPLTTKKMKKKLKKMMPGKKKVKFKTIA